MIAIFGIGTGVLIGVALLFSLLAGAALALESERGREWLLSVSSMEPAELRFRGMVSIGVGICCFAALVTLKLFAPVPLWSALTLGVLAVGSCTLGAALLERAAALGE